MSVLTLYPFSALEVTGGKGGFLACLSRNGFRSASVKRKTDLVDVFKRATFPEITDQDDARRRQWFESYITTILQRDVCQIANIAKLGGSPESVTGIGKQGWRACERSGHCPFNRPKCRDDQELSGSFANDVSDF
jgi:predicted AAA+ superfamily ATPase